MQARSEMKSLSSNSPEFRVFEETFILISIFTFTINSNTSSRGLHRYSQIERTKHLGATTCYSRRASWALACRTCIVFIYFCNSKIYINFGVQSIRVLLLIRKSFVLIIYNIFVVHYYFSFPSFAGIANIVILSTWLSR